MHRSEPRDHAILRRRLRALIHDLRSLEKATAVGKRSQRWTVRAPLAQQLRTLEQMDHDMTAIGLTRRVWSLGQATVPVLEALAGKATRGNVAATEAAERVRSSLAAFERELVLVAEGRDASSAPGDSAT